MTSKDIQQELTVVGWAQWLRWAKKNNVKNEGGRWPDYDYNEFINALEVITNEVASERRSDSSGDKSVVSSDVPKSNGVGNEVELQSHNNVSSRRESYVYELPLQESSNGPEDFRPPSEPPFRLPKGPEGDSGA